MLYGPIFPIKLKYVVGFLQHVHHLFDETITVVDAFNLTLSCEAFYELLLIITYLYYSIWFMYAPPLLFFYILK